MSEALLDRPGVSFRSTRDPEITAGTFDSLVNGLASDGGLFVPKEFPEAFSDNFIANLGNLNLSQISERVLGKMIPETVIDDKELQEMMEVAHNFNIPMESLSRQIMVLWLSEGPTASFKDVAARAIAQLMEKYCEDESTPKNIIVATSGDTGVAIADAFGGSKWVTVTVLYPANEVSPVQEAQMQEAARAYKNVQCLPIDGVFDDAQNIAKILLAARDTPDQTAESVTALVEKAMGEYNQSDFTPDLAKKLIEGTRELDLSSANSINIWRLIPQMVQYFYGYGQMVKKGRIKPGEEIVYAVPTGNVGHLMAGLYAKELGLPIKKFIVASNENDIMTNIIQDGVIKHNGLRDVDGKKKAKKTWSNSMDIANPSNLERLLDFAAQKVSPNAKIEYAGMKKAIQNFDINEYPEGVPLADFGVTPEMLEYLKANLYSYSVDDDTTIAQMHETNTTSDNGTVLEPHGATAAHAIPKAINDNFISDNDQVIILETAHPDKFPDALEEAGLKVHPHKVHDQLEALDSDQDTVLAARENVVTAIDQVLAAVQDIANASAERRAV